MFSLLAALVSIVLGVIPLVGPVIQGVVVVPIVAGGLLGMAHVGITRSPGLSDFTASSKGNFKRLAGAYLLLMVGAVVGLVLAAILVAVVLVTMGLNAVALTDPTSAGMSAIPTGGTAMIAFGAVVLVLMFVAAVVLQFLDVSVVGGESMTSAFRASWRLVADSPLSVIGYMLVRVGVFLALLGIPAGLMVLGRFAANEAFGVALGALGCSSYRSPWASSTPTTSPTTSTGSRTADSTTSASSTAPESYGTVSTGTGA